MRVPPKTRRIPHGSRPALPESGIIRIPRRLIGPAGSSPLHTLEEQIAVVDDRELLDGLRGDGEDAFSAIFRAYYAPLVGLAEGMLHDRAVAEDVVQEVMLELWRRRASIAVHESLRAYLYQATRNRSLNQLRRGRVEERAEPRLTLEHPSSPATDAEQGEEELALAIRDAIAAMPEGVREAFELSRTHGLTYTEIASALGIAVKTVEARMGKGLRLLRVRLAPWLQERTGR